MAIPKYDEMYRAFMDCLADMQVHKSKEVKELLAAKFQISDEERHILLPNGHRPIFDNRVGWTRTYLKKAGLIDSPSRGAYQLTQTGKQVLVEDPPVLDNHYLEQFDSFCQFIGSDSSVPRAVASRPIRRQPAGHSGRCLPKNQRCAL